MIRTHDQWSKLGEKNMGEHNIAWAKKMEDFHMDPPGNGIMTLMKAIMNDYWADATTPTDGWPKFHVDMVMSKLYWCWVAWMDATHMEVGEEE
jgi:hypothetical protein